MAMTIRMPSMFVTHGGGPMPILGDPHHVPLTKFLQGAAKLLPSRPSAVVVLTAHWETSIPTISTNPKPSMLYDYGGFPPESYQLQYPAPGAPPALVDKVKQLLNAGGFPELKEDSKRGYDHGTFIPLMLMFPEADIPVLQMSIMSNLDPKAHYMLGVALQPLRDEGVLILGSGSSFHNMQGFFTVLRGCTPGSCGPDPVMVAAKVFDDWLVDSCTKRTGADRQGRLEAWTQAPGASQSHPREEHLIPLMVVAGAAGQGQGHAAHRFSMGAADGSSSGLALSSFLFD